MTDDTLLLRHVEERYVDDGHVTRQAFLPLPEKDNGLLSVYNGDLIDPPKATKHFATRSRVAVLGVMAVTPGECKPHQLPAREDPSEFPEHAVVDMSHLSKGKQKDRARDLRDIAAKRGWLFKAEV